MPLHAVGIPLDSAGADPPRDIQPPLHPVEVRERNEGGSWRCRPRVPLFEQLRRFVLSPTSV
jgi:hypothetical protein